MASDSTAEEGVRCTVQIPIVTPEEERMIFDIEKTLSKQGVKFDTGIALDASVRAGFVTRTREWFLDNIEDPDYQFLGMTLSESGFEYSVTLRGD